MVGEMIDPIGLDQMIEREGDVVRQTQQQLGFFLVEEAHARCVDREHADGASVDRQREQREGERT